MGCVSSKHDPTQPKREPQAQPKPQSEYNAPPEETAQPVPSSVTEPLRRPESKKIIRDYGTDAEVEARPAKPAEILEFFDAVANGNEARVNAMIASHFPIKTVKDTTEETALHVAAENGHENIAAQLLAGMCSAVSRSSCETEGADINAVTKDGFTALHLACRAGSEGIVERLLAQDADVTVLSKQQTLALHEAALSGNSQVVKFLLDRDSSIVNTGDESSNTPLHIAAKAGNIDVVKLLLALPNIQGNARNIKRLTPQAMAVRYPQTRAVIEEWVKQHPAPATDLFAKSPLPQSSNTTTPAPAASAEASSAPAAVPASVPILVAVPVSEPVSAAAQHVVSQDATHTGIELALDVQDALARTRTAFHDAADVQGQLDLLGAALRDIIKALSKPSACDSQLREAHLLLQTIEQDAKSGTASKPTQLIMKCQRLLLKALDLQAA